MVKSLPDKWIRKAVFDAIDGLIVDSLVIPCYDVRVSRGENKSKPQHYVIMSTQSNEVDKNNKCEWFWESQILLDVLTSYDLPGNPGSRLLSDNILDAVRDAVSDLTLDVGSGLEIIKITQSFPSDISTTTRNENIFRKFLRLELLIK